MQKVNAYQLKCWWWKDAFYGASWIMFGFVTKWFRSSVIFGQLKHSLIKSTVLPLPRCPILTCSSKYTNGFNFLESSNCFLSSIVLLYGKLFSSISSFSISLSINFNSLSSFGVSALSILMSFYISNILFI